MANEYMVNSADLTSVANAIREKNKTTDYLAFPNGFISAIQAGGGAELNFEVVGGTTQPSNPKENTIWVNTNTEITEWGIYNAAPSSAVEGTVVITTYSNSICGFNALEENAIQILPGIACQYISGSWVSKSAQIYQSGKWTYLVVSADLFKNGDLCESLTGGWNTGYTYSESSAIGQWNEVSIGTTLYVGGRSGPTYNHGGIIGTNNKVNLSGYSSIRVKGTASLDSTWGGNAILRFGINTSKTITSSPEAYLSFTSSGSFDRLLTIPSGVSSAYIFLLGILKDGYVEQYNNTVSISQITLE